MQCLMLLWKLLTSVLEVNAGLKGTRLALKEASTGSNFFTNVVEDPKEEERCTSEEDFDPTNWNS